jgi:hypothetical protein
MTATIRFLKALNACKSLTFQTETKLSAGKVIEGVFLDSEELYLMFFYMVQQLRHSISATCFKLLCAKRLGRTELPTACGCVVVKAPCCKPEGRGFENRKGE